MKTYQRIIPAFFFLTIIFVLSGCSSNSSSDIKGSWESNPRLPSKLIGRDKIGFAPNKVPLTITDKFLYFFNEKPMEYTVSKNGNTYKIKIDKDSLTASIPPNMLRGQKLKFIPNMQEITCTLLDHEVMDCNLFEWWAGSNYHNRVDVYNFYGISIDPVTIRFKRIASDSNK